MLNNTNNSPLFYEYYAQWVDVYKKGAIREATMAKYLMTQKWIQKLAPELKVSELTRTAYQQILNDYAKEHDGSLTKVLDLMRDDRYYPDFESFEPYCKFGGCNHIGERDCGVKDAVALGELNQRRYDNYSYLFEELKQIKKY